MPYLMYGYAAAVVLMLLGCRVAARTIPGLRGMRLLVAALCCGLLSVILLSIRPYAPAWLTIVIANQALYACSLLIYCTVTRMLGVRMTFLLPGVLLGIAALAGGAWYTWIHPWLEPRILISSGACAIYAAAAAVTLFLYQDPVPDPLLSESPLRSFSRTLGRLQAILAFLCITRCLLTVLYPPDDFIHLDLIQAGFSYFNLLLYAGTGGGLIWLAVCAHRRDLQILARTDSLTGLLNRRAFEEILAREMRRSRHAGGSVSVLMLDIDRFKEVNDTLGHPAGDEVIRRVGGSLGSSTRPADALARYGGEEFVVLLRDRSLSQAEEIAERLRSDIADLTGLPGGVRITASIGVAASYPEESAEQLLRRCDDALYGSKRGGRNLVTTHRLISGTADTAPQPA